MAAITADKSFPFNGGTALEGDWRDLFGSWLNDGVCAGVDSELLVYGDSTGRHVKVLPGRVRIAGVHAEWAGTTTVTLAANSSGNPRIDRIVARLVTTGTEHVEMDVLQGTPGTTPVAPTLTYTSSIMEISLGQVNLASGYTTVPAQSTFPTAPVAGAPVGERRLLSMGSDPTYDTNAARDLWLPTPAAGMVAATRDKGARYFYDGTQWKQMLRHVVAVSYTPSSNEDTGSNATWPVGLTVSAPVPKWATRCRLWAKISNASPVSSTVANVDVSLRVGSTVVDLVKHRWIPDQQTLVATANATDLTSSEALANALKTALNNLSATVGAGSRNVIELGGDVDVTALAGTTVNVNTLGNVVAGGTVLRVNGESPSALIAEFR